METLEPRIIAFCCHYCAYSAADLAGSMRLEYSPNVRIVKLMCTGRVDTIHLLKAFEDGADGVMVLGCHIGDCHYINANHRTVKRIPLLQNLLGYVGIDPERLVLDWVSSAEAPKFAQVTTDFVEKIRQLGPIAEEMGLAHPAVNMPLSSKEVSS